MRVFKKKMYGFLINTDVICIKVCKFSINLTKVRKDTVAYTL